MSQVSKECAGSREVCFTYLCRVCMRGTLFASVLFKVLQELLGVIPQFAIVHNSPTTLQQNQIIKVLK